MSDEKKTNAEPVQAPTQSADRARAIAFMQACECAPDTMMLAEEFAKIRSEAVLEERRRAQQVGQPVPCPETPVARALDIPVIRETDTRVVNDGRGYRRYAVLRVEVLESQRADLEKMLRPVDEKGEAGR